VTDEADSHLLPPRKKVASPRRKKKKAIGAGDDSNSEVPWKLISVFFLLLAFFGGSVGLRQMSPKSEAYAKGHAYGRSSGDSDRRHDVWNLEEHKATAYRLGRISQTEGCRYQIGTNEYGDYMKGLEAGYFETRQ
jgi:hypothetical protein